MYEAAGAVFPAATPSTAASPAATTDEVAAG